MDSGSSGSMQSSSGGDDQEYDSRAGSAPVFMNPPSHYGSMSNLQPLIFSPHQNHQSNLLDLSSNYTHAFSQSQANSHPNSMLHNIDAVQSRGPRSEANCTGLGNVPPSSSSSSQSILAARGLDRGSSPSSMQIRPVHDNGARATAQPNVVRNSKKRTRATRRAPTTVLSTDTSNFRAMVQEFTGIPSPPFSGSSVPYFRRFDLFGNSSALRPGNLEPAGVLHPLRPSAQKVHSSPFVSSSPSSSAFNNTMGDIAINTNTLNNLYPQVPSNLGFPRQTRNMLNVQNPILTFQSLPQPSVHPSFNVSGFGAPPPGSVGIPSLEELGMSHGHVNVNLSGLPNHEAGSNDGNEDRHFRSLDGNYGSNSARVGGCKLNYSTSSSSDFNHEKALGNVSTRGSTEGTFDSWICPSD
ncbi:hypothetical protein I3760_07G178300 [Carya illinoinensis]|nr:hypothetical protein I3760_07G178300 [Carya illinoinensis]